MDASRSGKNAVELLSTYIDEMLSALYRCEAGKEISGEGSVGWVAGELTMRGRILIISVN
jgi:hypothetical protein